MSDENTIELDDTDEKIHECIRAYVEQEGVIFTLNGFINFVSARLSNYSPDDISGDPAIMVALLGKNWLTSTQEKPKMRQPLPIAERTTTVTQFIERYKSREGQGRFRKRLIDKYGCQCMATGKTTSDIIEAAHIDPFYVTENHDPQNGLLLSREIHRLFDRGKLSFDPDNEYAIVLDPTVKDDLQLLPRLTTGKEALRVHDDALRLRHEDFTSLIRTNKP